MFRHYFTKRPTGARTTVCSVCASLPSSLAAPGPAQDQGSAACLPPGSRSTPGQSHVPRRVASVRTRSFLDPPGLEGAEEDAYEKGGAAPTGGRGWALPTWRV